MITINDDLKFGQIKKHLLSFLIKSPIAHSVNKNYDSMKLGQTFLSFSNKYPNYSSVIKPKEKASECCTLRL